MLTRVGVVNRGTGFVVGVGEAGHLVESSAEAERILDKRAIAREIIVIGYAHVWKTGSIHIH